MPIAELCKTHFLSVFQSALSTKLFADWKTVVLPMRDTSTSTSTNITGADSAVMAACMLCLVLPASFSLDLFSPYTKLAFSYFTGLELLAHSFIDSFIYT